MTLTKQEQTQMSDLYGRYLAYRDAVRQKAPGIHMTRLFHAFEAVRRQVMRWMKPGTIYVYRDLAFHCVEQAPGFKALAIGTEIVHVADGVAQEEESAQSVETAGPQDPEPVAEQQAADPVEVSPTESEAAIGNETDAALEIPDPVDVPEEAAKIATATVSPTTRVRHTRTHRTTARRAHRR